MLGASNSGPHFVDPVLAVARRNEAIARIVLGILCSIIAILFMFASFLPTSYNWDPEMPDYSDPDAVSRAILTSGFTALLAAIGTVLLWRWKLLMMLPSIILAIGIYRFITLLPHLGG
jgi:hypothetical protein